MNYKKIVSQYSTSNTSIGKVSYVNNVNDNTDPEFQLKRIRNSKDEALIQYSESNITRQLINCNFYRFKCCESVKNLEKEDAVYRDFKFNPKK